MEKTGTFMRMPYDWRMPTKERIKAEVWNPDDKRLFTPKAFGAGWGVNFYWLTHRKPSS